MTRSCQDLERVPVQALADSDFVVEAIKEDEAVKKTAFSLLDNVRILLHTIAQALSFYRSILCHCLFCKSDLSGRLNPAAAC